MRNARLVSGAALLVVAWLAACNAQRPRAPAEDSGTEGLRPVIVQGALDGYPVVVSNTMKGVSNAAAATAIAADHYRPVAIVNQGTAGGHEPQLHVYDIVLGKYSVNGIIQDRVPAGRTGQRFPGMETAGPDEDRRQRRRRPERAHHAALPGQRATARRSREREASLPQGPRR